MDKEIKLGVIGLGMVGSAVFKYFYKQDGVRAFGYDKYKKNSPNTFKEVEDNCDIIILCLPTPYIKGGFNIESIEDTLKELKPGYKAIIIKSTVLPGTTEMLQNKYEDKGFAILFNPEFLDENTAKEDFEYPQSQIVGYTDISYGVAEYILSILPEASYQKIMRSTEAEMVKLTKNTFFVYKVIFGNLIYDICKEKGINYFDVVEGLLDDSRIGEHGWTIYHKGGRGAGGHCLPKDSNAFVDWIENKGNEHKLLNIVKNLNHKYLVNSNKDVDIVTNIEKKRCE